MIKHLTLSLAVLALPATALAQQAPATPQVIQNLAACVGVEDDSERLACYDAAAQSLVEAESSGDLVAIERQQVRDLEREAFGLSLPALPGIVSSAFAGIVDGEERDGAGQLSSLTLTIARAEQFDRDKLRVTFENGQVWEQIDRDPVRTSMRLLQGREAEIRSALVGSHLMTIDGHRRAIRVRRVE